MPVSTGATDYYGLLGIAPDATPEEIKHAFRRTVRATHPRLNPGADVAQFERVRRAYEVLANPAERARYDAVLGLGARAGHARGYRRSYGRLFDRLITALPHARPFNEAAA